MARIGGNTKAVLYKKCSSGKNEIGMAKTEWKKLRSVTGWLDMQSFDAKHTVYDARIQESTHVFLTDYFDFRKLGLSSENVRLEVFGETYDVTLIDDPMELHQHIEIYLKFVGGLNGRT